jgi:hypothetical protein
MDAQVHFCQAGANITNITNIPRCTDQVRLFEKGMMSAREVLLARMALAKVVPTIAAGTVHSGIAVSRQAHELSSLS